MAKRDSGSKQTRATTATSTVNSTASDAMEQRVVAFAEQQG